MELTTGSVLRRITQTDLSVAAHKLATLILDGIAWKDGYNGLSRGTAAFTLQALAERMGVSRQYLSVLLGELATSPLRLERQKPHGKYAPWLFRFEGVVPDDADPIPSSGGDTSLSKGDSNKTVFSGWINIAAATGSAHSRWITVIGEAQASLPCWNVDARSIWDRFVAFNRQRGQVSVPAGYLLGFMRRWRVHPSAPRPAAPAGLEAPLAGASHHELLLLAKAAPSSNWRYHAADLRRKIGDCAYDERVKELVRKLGCVSFTAMLAVHGQAVMAGEIVR